MPVEFLTDEQVAGYAAFERAPSRADLERFFFLDDVDRELVESKRREHNRLGFAVLLTSVRTWARSSRTRSMCRSGVVDYLAEQLEIADTSVPEGVRGAGEHPLGARTGASPWSWATGSSPRRG